MLVDRFHLVPIGGTNEAPQRKFERCCGFYQKQGFEAGRCTDSDCLTTTATATANAAGSSDNVVQSRYSIHQSIDDPPTIRSEVLNIPGRLKKFLFSPPINGKLLLDAEFGVFTAIDERDTLAVFGSEPMRVERCVLLVEECIKNPTFCLEWYKNSKRT